MRAVDTNVLVRLLTRDDAKQAAAADRYVDGGAWISQIVLAESTWVLDSVYGLEPAQIAIAVDMLLNHKDLTIESAEVVGAALERFRCQTTLGFSDCLIVEVARKAGHLPLGTFDKELAKLDGAQKL